MAKKANDIDTSKIELNMTPLIDVTFLILIFLMVLPFKTLERKVAAFLPKDRGLAKTKIKLEEKPKITVTLKRTAQESQTRVVLMDRPLGVDETGFMALDQQIEAISRNDKEIPGEINAWPEVPHQDVIRTIDAFMKNKVLDITFVGTAPPGKQTLGATDPNSR
jgi:biopolymer transport protein ExbD